MKEAAQGAIVVTAQVKNWTEFQHYKDRSPPWIKLQRSLLDDYDFARLPLASKALAPLLWLLASESMAGTVRIDAEWLAFRLRFTVADIEAGLTPLIHMGFLIVDSEALAGRLQGACLEAEAEAEAEEKGAPPPKPKKEKTKAPELTLTDWSIALDGADPIATDDPIFAWAETAGIPADWIAVAWAMFEDRYAEDAKKYADWRAVFRKAVKGDWLKVWRMDAREGRFVLTTAGELARRSMA